MDAPHRQRAVNITLAWTCGDQSRLWHKSCSKQRKPSSFEPFGSVETPRLHSPRPCLSHTWVLDSFSCSRSRKARQLRFTWGTYKIRADLPCLRFLALFCGANTGICQSTKSKVRPVPGFLHKYILVTRQRQEGRSKETLEILKAQSTSKC